jgi:hypothetical protein
MIVCAFAGIQFKGSFSSFIGIIYHVKRSKETPKSVLQHFPDPTGNQEWTARSGILEESHMERNTAFPRI